MNTPAKLSVNENIVLRKEDDDAFLYDPETGSVSVINNTGILIWENLHKGKNTGEIIAALLRDFPEEPPERIRSDCELFIKNLIEINHVREI
ncbi:PqqD family protein [Candidatus Auribacterota bacterium]